ncbi:hypothetical protein MAR_037017 [Mya arenaria]|uniref:Uncharacterized protein n=1 Tax=Mya arenaria TaxID=6604 RepID=A0ABY7FRG2_MYAAR|nr:hypothetical protein MAR_037017 [Mya arenaria]
MFNGVGKEIQFDIKRYEGKFVESKDSTPMKRSMSISEIPPLSPSLYPVSSLNNSIHMTEFQPERAGDRRTDPGLERRMEQIRREMLGEVQLLQSQLQITSAKGSNLQVSDTQLLSMNRDVLEIKHAFRDELEGSRRDIEILRSRITKLELELAGTMSGRREVERRQDNMDRTLCSLTTTQTKPQIPSSALAMMNTNRQLEKLQINTLRATLSSLQGKIDMLEQSQPLTSSSKISPSSKPVFSNGFSAQFKPDNDLIDDIDLSDGGSSESSDFTEFEQDMPKDKMSRPLRKQTHIIEEEVDTGNDTHQSA